MPALPCPVDRWPRFSELLDIALELPEPDREGWLTTLANDDADLRDALARVLHTGSGEKLSGYLNGPPVLPETKESDRTGERIGPWRLLEALGRGGMGEVWRAERDDGAYQRIVALKLPHAHLASDAIRLRFRRERDILARLQHPNIAQFYDAGIADDGRPWLALELVHGRSILAWSDERRLDPNDRIRLMIPVCAAVHAAHRALVIHRDIKPSNILVAGNGEAKLLDFGIARLIDDTTGEHTQTLAMTPAYATPEQWRGGLVTTASDIYQLGLVLYELLSGIPARHGNERRDASPPAMRVAFDRLQRSEPATVEAIAQSRSMPMSRLRPILAGDLERIVEKALAEDPAQRYDSANDLADDLQRFLDRRPVRARRASIAYRLRRFASRHPATLALVGILSVALAGTLVKAELDGRQRLAEVSAERTQARASLDFLADLFAAAGPDGLRGPDASARDVLYSGIERLQHDSTLSPQARSELFLIIGESLNSLSRVNDAQAAFEHAAHEQEKFTAGAGERTRLRLRQAINAQDRGELREARTRIDDLVADIDAGGQTSRHAIEARALQANLSLIDGDMTRALAELAPAMPLLDRPDIGLQADEIADTLFLHGTILNELGRSDEAQRDIERALVLYQQGDGVHPSIGKTLAALALIHQDKGEFGEAERLFTEGTRSMLATLGPDSRDLMIGRGNHAALLLAMGRPQQAVEELLETLRIVHALALDDPMSEGRLRNRLGQALIESGDIAGARTELTTALTLAQRGNDRDIIERAGYALLYLDCLDGQSDAVEKLDARLPSDDANPTWRLRAGLFLARCHESHGHIERAHALFQTYGELAASAGIADSTATALNEGIERTAATPRQ